ncbi:DUF4384 domain-containing protein [Candidatus Acetothermia bacterium]|nr:DUF4384 domain-containing protein [Candidatus Acetothermia bacterium]MBI3642727.1 DUF4384 domain-containing protein [Candidatus Acetothermia bacterium]
MNVKRFTVMIAVMAIISLFGQLGLAQAPQGIVPIPSNSNIQVDVSLAKASYQVGEEITIQINTTAPSVGQVYLNVVDIDAAGNCSLIFPNAFSPNSLVPVGQFSLSDRPNLYRFQVVPPFGTEYVQAFASLDPLDLRTLFNANPTPGNPFPTLCTNPAQFAQQVQAAIQGIIAVGRIASDFASFVVTSSNPNPPPPTFNQAPIAQFTASPQFALAGQVIQFISNSFDPDAGDFVTQNIWNFGDGMTAVGATTFHIYALPGTYQVTLTAVDNHGAASSTAQLITVLSFGGNPSPQQGGYYVTRVDSTHFKLTIQGQADWFVSRAYQIHLEANNGFFTTVNQSASGNAAAQGIQPVPVNQNILNFSGLVGTGKVEYTIGISSTTTQVKFDLQLDSDANGIMEHSRNFIFLGTELKHPPSDPFILSFTTPGQIDIFLNIQVCLVLVNQPGLFISLCFNFQGL